MARDESTQGTEISGRAQVASTRVHQASMSKGKAGGGGVHKRGTTMWLDRVVVVETEKLVQRPR